ncbi:MAG: putative Ig domain-containing protein [Gammaproteobacteria bacterium]
MSILASWLLVGQAVAQNAPTISSIEDKTVRVGQYYAIDLTSYVTEMDGDAVSYDLSVGPSGVLGSFDDFAANVLGDSSSYFVENTGLLIVNLGSNGTAGSSELQFSATDLDGTATVSFNLIVQPEFLADISNMLISSGSGSLDLATYTTEDDITWDATEVGSTTLPTGFSLSGSTLSYSGLAAGSNHDLAVTATLTLSDTVYTDTSAFRITVASATGVSSTLIEDLEILEDATTNLQLSDYFSSADTLSYTVVEQGTSSLPAGITLTGSVLELLVESLEVATSYNLQATASTSTESASLDFTVTFVPINDAPEFAGPIAQQTVALGSSATLDVSGYFSDEESDPLTFEATQVGGTALPSWITLAASTGIFTFAPSASDNISTEVFSIEVIASDFGLDAAASFNLAVSLPPVLSTLIPEKSVGVGETLVLELSGFFTSSQTLSYSFSSTPSASWMSIDATTGAMEFAPTSSSDIADYTVTATATTPASLSASDTFVLSVLSTQSPEVASDALTAHSVAVTAISTIDASAIFSDPEGLVLTYATAVSGQDFSSWISIDSSSGLITLAPTQAALAGNSYTLTVTATNASNLSTDHDITLSVSANTAPTVATTLADVSLSGTSQAYIINGFSSFFADAEEATRGADGELDVAVELTALNDAGDTDDEVLDIAVISWFTVAGDVITVAPSNNLVGTYRIKLTAEDSGGLTGEQAFDLEITFANVAPAVVANNDVSNSTYTIIVGASQEVDISGVFSDADGDALTLTADQSDGTALPAWVVFDAAELTVTAEPTSSADIGDITVRLTASDGTLSISTTFDITVLAANMQPTLVSALSDQQVDEDSVLSTTSVKVNFSDPEGISLNLSAALSDGNALPSFITFTASTGVFRFAPTLTSEADTYSIEVTASDGALSVSDTFDLTVTAVDDTPIVAVVIADQSATEDATAETLDVSSNFSDEETSTLTLSAALANGNALPSFITFTASTGMFSFAPTLSSQAGTYSIEVTASDGALSISDTFDLTVSAVNDSPVFSGPIPMQVVEAGTTGTLSVTQYFQDEESQSLTFSTSVGGVGSGDPAFPSFITFTAATGAFSFSPTQAERSMAFTVTVQATDEGNKSAMGTFTLTVGDEDSPPVLVGGGIEDTEAFEDAVTTFDIASSFTDPAGDALTFTSTLADGVALPAFVTLSGSEFTFAPTLSIQAGIYSIEVTASDNSSSVSDIFDLIVTPVNDAPIAAVSVMPANGIPDQVYTEDDPAIVIALSDYFSDEEDNDNLAYAIERVELDTVTDLYVGTGVIPPWAVVDNTANTLTIELLLSNTGAATGEFQITATDSGGLEAEDIFKITLDERNDPPSLLFAIIDQEIPVDTETVFSVGGFFVDEESDSLSFSATLDGSSLPDWIDLAIGGRFTFNPTTANEGTYTISVTATDSTLSVTDEFELTVLPAPALAQDVWESTLGQQFSMINTSVADSIGGRMSRIGSVKRADSNTVALMLSQYAGSDRQGNLRQLLNGKTLGYQLGSSYSSQATGTGASSIWLTSNSRTLEQTGASSWEADLSDMVVGFDTRVGSSLVIGLVYVNSSGDYAVAASGGSNAFQYTNDVTSTHPWVGLSAGNLNLWVSAGEGDGTLEIDDGNSSVLTTDVALSSVQFGLEFSVAEWLALSLTNSSSDFSSEAVGNIQRMESSLDEMRVAINAKYSFKVGSSVLTPKLIIASRDQSIGESDGELSDPAHSGTEMGFDIDLRTASGLGLALGSRSFSSDTEGYDETGSFFALSFDFGVPNRGFIFELKPSYGHTDSRSQELVDGFYKPQVDSLGRQSKLSAEISYPTALGSAWLVSPYVSFDRSSADSQSRISGVRFGFTRAIDLAFSHRERQSLLGTEQSVELQGRLSF